MVLVGACCTEADAIGAVVDWTARGACTVDLIAESLDDPVGALADTLLAHEGREVWECEAVEVAEVAPTLLKDAS